jgi:hypothetical protein
MGKPSTCDREGISRESGRGVSAAGRLIREDPSAEIPGFDRLRKAIGSRVKYHISPREEKILLKLLETKQDPTVYDNRDRIL